MLLPLYAIALWVLLNPHSDSVIGFMILILEMRKLDQESLIWQVTANRKRSWEEFKLRLNSNYVLMKVKYTYSTLNITLSSERREVSWFINIMKNIILNKRDTCLHTSPSFLVLRMSNLCWPSSPRDFVGGEGVQGSAIIFYHIHLKNFNPS